MSGKNMKLSNKAFIAMWSGILGFLLVLVIVANILCSTLFYGILTTFFDGGEKVVQGSGTIYYQKTALDHDAAISDSMELVKSIQAEGTVLLKNDGFLPMNGDEKLTLFGRDSVDFMYGGGGSGGLSNRITRATMKEVLEKSGFTVNPVVWELLDSVKSKYNRGTSGVSQLLSVGEIPLSEYTVEAKNSYKQYGDCAIVTIGRSGSEGTDLDTGDTETAHALELEKDERDIIKEACDNFANVIVVINSSATPELGFLNEYPQIKAALYMGFTGDTGLEVLGEILNGNINPSGHTADTFAYDLTTAPSYANMTSTGFAYSNAELDENSKYFIEYEEGIYVGYRWYETADAEGFWSSDYADDRWGVKSYDDVVQFPFGFGLSYTTFEWTVDGSEWKSDDGKITVQVTVKNTGKTEGKDVVQLYYSAPYDAKDGIEKSSVVLGGFAKTKSIPAGESDTVTIEMNVQDMASYDYKTEQAYVLSAGEYVLSLRTDAHTVKLGDNMQKTFTVDDTVVYNEDNARTGDLKAAVNLFDDVSSHIKTYLSRSDFQSTMPTPPDESDRTASKEIVDGVKAFTYDTFTNSDKPVTDAGNGVELVELIGKDYEDPMWNTLLDNLSISDMDKLVSIGGYKTVGISSVNKPVTVDPDGPGGFSSFFTKSIYGSGFCSEVVVACTFNVELAEAMGNAIGEEGLHGGYSGWYAPGVNIHRSPFGGRNFEYYSEDPLLSGMMGAYVIKGCAQKGVYCYVKHFAVNDQETKRNGILTWLNEQAMREVYLKPFELAVKVGKTTAIMSSFNRLGTVWAGGNYKLLTEILRNEWGFKGMVVTDYHEGAYMNTDQMLSAGGDLMMDTIGTHPADISSAKAIAAMRNASKNILYTVANSNAMNGIKKGEAVKTEMPSWVKWQIAIDVIAFAAIAVGAVLVALHAVKNKRSKADLETND